MEESTDCLSPVGCGCRELCESPCSVCGFVPPHSIHTDPHHPRRHDYACPSPRSTPENGGLPCPVCDDGIEGRCPACARSTPEDR